MTQRMIEQLKDMASNQAETVTSCYGVVVSQDNASRALKVILEPYGVESGWLRVLQRPYLPKKHSPHTHNEPPLTTSVENQALNHEKDDFSSYNWVGQEVIVLMLYSDFSSGVVLGPLW